MLKEVSQQYDNSEDIVENFIEIIDKDDSDDSDDSSTGIECKVLNSDINELEESIIGLPRQFKSVQLNEDTVIIATKKAHNQSIQTSKKCAIYLIL